MDKSMNDVSRRYIWILKKVINNLSFRILLWLFDIIWRTRIFLGLTHGTYDSKLFRPINLSDWIEGHRNEEAQSVEICGFRREPAVRVRQAREQYHDEPLHSGNWLKSATLSPQLTKNQILQTLWGERP